MKYEVDTTLKRVFRISPFYHPKDATRVVGISFSPLCLYEVN